MKKADKQIRAKMAKEIKFLNSLKPHYLGDETQIKVIQGSRFNEIARIEQKNHVIPIHRLDPKQDFIPIVWNRSFEFVYELAKTMYEPTYLKIG